MRTKKSPALTLVQGGAGVEGSGSASTIYGCEKVGSTTWLATSKEAQLSELLNDLERKVETLESRYLEACATLSIVTARLAELKVIKIGSTITKEELC